MARSGSKESALEKVTQPSEAFQKYVKSKKGFRLATADDYRRKKRNTEINNSQLMQDCIGAFKIAVADGGFGPHTLGLHFDCADMSNPLVKELLGPKGDPKKLHTTLSANLKTTAESYGLSRSVVHTRRGTMILIGGEEL